MTNNPSPTDKPISSRELIKRCGQDPDEPLGRIEFPSEMRMRPATDEEAQRGLNDTWPGDPVPASPTVDDELVALGVYDLRACGCDICNEKADRITDLTARLERYRGLLIDVPDWLDDAGRSDLASLVRKALSDSTEGDLK